MRSDRDDARTTSLVPHQATASDRKEHEDFAQVVSWSAYGRVSACGWLFVGWYRACASRRVWRRRGRGHRQRDEFARIGGLRRLGKFWRNFGRNHECSRSDEHRRRNQHGRDDKHRRSDGHGRSNRHWRSYQLGRRNQHWRSSSRRRNDACRGSDEHGRNGRSDAHGRWHWRGGKQRFWRNE
jgi:hypothetical protein